MKYVVEINKVRYFLEGNSKKFFIENNKKTPQEWNGLSGKEVSQQIEDDINALACYDKLSLKRLLSIRTFLLSVQIGLMHIPYNEKLVAYTILTDPIDKHEENS